MSGFFSGFRAFYADECQSVDTFRAWRRMRRRWTPRACRTIVTPPAFIRPSMLSDSPFSAPGATRGGDEVIPVSALNRAISTMLERSFPLLWISGEVSNFTRAASGHWYFSIKDQQAQMRCVMFRGRAQYAEFTPREGDRIEVRAVVTMYEPRGEVQLNVEAVRRTGQGRLYEAFLRLKAQLEAEGLFAPERKRPLPPHPRAIGIVTSLQAAALRDVLTTLARRAPHIPVIVYPAPVQGAGSAEKLVAAVAAANARREVDVLLVCRGGGSIEDLWSFNDEALARAIAASELPVVSGVGHETDFTIADFAAGARCTRAFRARATALAARAARCVTGAPCARGAVATSGQCVAAPSRTRHGACVGLCGAARGAEPAAHARARLCGADRCADGPRGARAERAEAAAAPDRASRRRLGRRVARRRAAAADRYDLT